jgi:single-strand DNA-binding protein
MNIVIIKGNITRNIETKYLPTGAAITEFGVALDDSYIKDGQKTDRVVFVECMAWGKTGETISAHLAKGSPILIHGKLGVDSWEDKQSGQKRSKTRIIIERFEFCGGSKKDERVTKKESDHIKAKGNGYAPKTHDEDGDEIPF